MIKRDSTGEGFSVVVVGGTAESSGSVSPFLDSVEILDDGATEWRSGTPYPRKVTSTQLVLDPLGAVAVIGGFDPTYELFDGSLDTFYYLSFSTDATWEQSSRKLSQPITNSVAFWVSDDLCQP